MAYRKFTPEAAALARTLMLELLATGRTQTAIMSRMKLNWRDLAAFRRDDPAWGEEIDRLLKEQPHGATTYTPEDIKTAKEAVLHRVAEEGRTLTEAAADLGLGKRVIAKWRREDSSFDQDIKDALLALADEKADSVLTLHEEIPDARMARVAMDGRQWWVRAHNSRYKDRPPVEDLDAGRAIAETLRAAVGRLIEMQRPTPLVTDAEAEPVSLPAPRRLQGQRSVDNGPPPEGT
jgi:cytidylate kinase